MYQRILIPTDGSACSIAATDHAMELAEAFGSRVTFVRVLEHHYLPASAPIMARQTETANSETEHYATKILDRAKEIALDRGIEAETVWEIDDHPQDVIVKHADGHDLIVMGSHGRSGLGRIMFGSVTQRVLHRANCPVLIISCRNGRKRK